MQKFSEPPLTTHEKCGGPVHRLISAPALQFKGSGWYITDYAKNSSGTSSGEKASENGSTQAKSDAGNKESSASKSDSPAPAAPSKSES